MFQRLNNYLLTHRPLLWNTKLVWVLTANAIIHLLFFLGGFASINRESLQEYYSINNVGEVSLFVFSVLCSLVVLILWLVFYLRNNAFKNWYIIDKWHLSKEFLLILIIVFTSITFYESFYFGVRTKAKTITSQSAFIKEVNTVNQAMAFVPEDIANYFILNKCGERTSMYPSARLQYFLNDSLAVITEDGDAKIKAALKRPDAFKYENYCYNFIDPRDYGTFNSDSVNNLALNKLLKEANRNSKIKELLKDFNQVNKKYGIENSLNADYLLLKLNNPINPYKFETVSTSKYTSYDGKPYNPQFYLNKSALKYALDFIDECRHPNEINTINSFLISGYVALVLAILFLCYRRFSKKVFLISLVGTIVLAIIISLFGIASKSEQVPLWLLLLLFVTFTIISLGLIKQKSSKIVAGVLLNWHVYLLPALAFIIVGLFSFYYHDYRGYRFDGTYLTDEERHKLFPISYWVEHHAKDIFRVNFLFAILYITLVFNKLAKKWHSNPDE